MRVLHADTGMEMRGGQYQVLYLVQGLGREGVHCRLLARRHSALYRRALELGIDVRPLSLRALWSLSGSVDLVHAHTAGAHTLGAVLARSPLVVSRRVAFPLTGGPLSRWKYSRAARYIAVSEYVRHTLVEAGVPAEKISVVYDGVPSAPPTSDGGAIVAPAGEDPAKGSDLVRRAANRAGMVVRFSANLAEDLPEASVFVYLTRSEGLGSAALAAMAAGVPVVASRVGGLPEAVQDGVTGLLTENDPEQAAAAIIRLAGDPALRRRLGEGGRRLVAEKFSVEAMVRGTLDVYRRVLSC